MLTEKEILQFIRDDMSSDRKRFARKGLKYYEGDHDIRKLQSILFQCGWHGDFCKCHEDNGQLGVGR